MRELLEEWAPRIYRFARRLTLNREAAEDLTQETLLRAWSRREQLRDRAAARVWLFRIAVNLRADQLRRDCVRADVEATTGALAEAEDHAPSPDKAACGREDLRRTLRALDALPSRQRQALYLHACEGLAPGEVASVLDISPEAARASLSLARKKLRQALPDLLTD